MTRSDVNTILWAIVAVIVVTINLLRDVENPTIEFSGYEWTVKRSLATRVGPGPNFFSREAVELTPEGLKLAILERNGGHYCAEVVCRQSLGYGKYTFHVASSLQDLDENAVLGMFTWSESSEPPNRELDIEVSKWGVSEEPPKVQFVVQPWDEPGNLESFPLPQGIGAVYTMLWTPEFVEFELRTRDGLTIRRSKFTREVPEPGNESIRINLWLRKGMAPAMGGSREVIIRKFEFEPWPQETSPSVSSMRGFATFFREIPGAG